MFVRKGVDRIPYVPIPLGGIKDPVLIRVLFYLDAWILLGSGVMLQGAWEVF